MVPGSEVLVIIGVPKERAARERRVALIPETVKRLVAHKHPVLIESGAGAAAAASDAEYAAAGARVVATREELFAQAQVLLKIQPPSDEELPLLRQGQALVCLLAPLTSPELLQKLCARGVDALSVDSIPRTTLAQMMDVLSSQATLAGYRAVLLAAEALPRLFPLLMTAAGTLAPARVLVLGAGVAGLQAIATARRLGATVEAFDVRRAAKEQVESLGARFVEVEGEDAEVKGGYAKETSEDYRKRQGALLLERIARADVCISTAQIPGKRAPILITEEMVRAMRPRSVIVDAAADGGGNCALTKPGERVIENGVTIIGELNLPAQVAVHASQMWSRNMEKLLLHLVGQTGADLRLDATDEITRGVITVRAGRVADPRLQPGSK
jgi:NAD(P) transhydrogenase subunit alpha